MSFAGCLTHVKILENPDQEKLAINHLFNLDSLNLLFNYSHIIFFSVLATYIARYAKKRQPPTSQSAAAALIILFLFFIFKGFFHLIHESFFLAFFL